MLPLYFSDLGQILHLNGGCLSWVRISVSAMFLRVRVPVGTHVCVCVCVCVRERVCPHSPLRALLTEEGWGLRAQEQGCR